MDVSRPPELAVCSFCGLPQSPDRPVVAGATLDIAICRQCVELCSEIFEEMENDAQDSV